MGLSETPKPNAPASELHDEGRGRQAETPTQIPKRGWLDVLSRTGKEVGNDNLSIVAAGVAFYAFVAVVPALAALIGLYGLIFNPAQVSEQITSFARILPQEVLPLIEQQLKRITTDSGTAGLSAIVGLLLAIWSSASATKALIQGLNITYGEREKRGFIKLNLVALALTIGIIAGAITAIALVAVMPAVLQHVHLGSKVETILNWARWPILLGGFILGLAVLFRYAPSRDDAKWRWVSPGAEVAAALWVIASGLFSFYVSKFGSYDKTYGSLAAVVVFLMWLYISAFVVLLGAELNSELERQTVKDTTTEPEKPMGQRGAVAADTVGPTRETNRLEEEKEKARPPSKQRRA
jgi:membrane protein